MATKCITTNQMSEKVSCTMCLNTNIALICALMQINKFVSNCFLTTNGPELSTIIGYTEKKMSITGIDNSNPIQAQQKIRLSDN